MFGTFGSFARESTQFNDGTGSAGSAGIALQHPQGILVVWIDLSRSLVMTRVLRRTIVRLATRRELWNGNRESLSTLWSRDGIVRWAWRTHAKNRSRYERMMEQADDGSWVCLRSPREVAGWLESLPAVSVD